MVLIKSMNYSGGSGISSVRLKEKEYTQKIIHIPKPEIKRFEIKRLFCFRAVLNWLLVIKIRILKLYVEYK